jgi:transcriptional regulator with XRE-family HTH domain
MLNMTLYSPQEVRQKLGQNARETRIAQRKTQSELASAAGISLSTLARFERGEDVAMSVLIQLALALGTESSLLTIFPKPEIRSFDDVVSKKPFPRRVRKRR